MPSTKTSIHTNSSSNTSPSNFTPNDEESYIFEEKTMFRRLNGCSRELEHFDVNLDENNNIENDKFDKNLTVESNVISEKLIANKKRIKKKKKYETDTIRKSSRIKKQVEFYSASVPISKIKKSNVPVTKNLHQMTLRSDQNKTKTEQFRKQYNRVQSSSKCKTNSRRKLNFDKKGNKNRQYGNSNQTCSISQYSSSNYYNDRINNLDNQPQPRIRSNSFIISPSPETEQNNQYRPTPDIINTNYQNISPIPRHTVYSPYAIRTPNILRPGVPNNTSPSSNLNPNQRVTRAVYRSGSIADPDIDMEVHDTHARIRLGSLNLTVSMKNQQTVNFKFSNISSLIGWENEFEDDGGNRNFPQGLNLPRFIEKMLKTLSSKSTLYSLNELTKIFNDIQDQCLTHPIALIIISILQSLNDLNRIGAKHDIDLVANVFSKQQVETNKFLRYTISPSDDCPICLLPLQEMYPIARLDKCRHTFHKDCLSKWHNVKFSCPLCRTNLSNLKISVEYKSFKI